MSLFKRFLRAVFARLLSVLVVGAVVTLYPAARRFFPGTGQSDDWHKRDLPGRPRE